MEAFDKNGTCEGCAYLVPIWGDGGIHDCRRFPPIMIRKELGFSGYFTRFPQLNNESCQCGEFHLEKQKKGTNK